MSKNLKKWMAGEIRDRMEGAEQCVVVGFHSHPATASGELRKSLRKSSVRFQVIRNRIAVHAVSGTTLAEISPLLKGPTAVATGGEDSVSLAKAVVEGLKGREGFEFRGGYVEGRLVTGDEVKHLAGLPGKKELLSMIASAVAMPMTNVACGVDAILTGVARAVEAVREKKEKEAAA